MGRLDIGADAAVPKEIDMRLQNGLDHLVRRRLSGKLEQRLRFARQGQVLCGPREYRAPLRHRTARIILPTGARQLEQPFALGEGAHGIGLRIDENMQVIEGRDQPDVRRLQHAVAEYVPCHVADAGDREILGLNVDADLAEVPFHAFPRAARRDRHLLMVVSGRAARGERVAEPEAVLLRDGIGDVGESRSTLVGCDHQVGVVLVVADHHGGSRDLVVDDVVGYIQKTPDQRLIARDHFSLLCFALGRHALDDESAFGPHRNDDRVLHLLCLHEPEHFGAEILAPIRPANAAARNISHAQVHAFHARREYEDLEQRLR